MTINNKIFLKLGISCLVAAAGLATSTGAQAHINLVSPPPLMSGHGLDDTALKAAPFGAPDVDVAAAKATNFKAGSMIDIDLEVYKIHPGEIVIFYTRDFEGEDVEPTYELASIKTPIPYKNLLLQAAAPCSPKVGCVTGTKSDQHFKASVKLPDIEGDIILVIRQVMRDKMIVDEDNGEVDLSEVYYHQAAKLHLTK